MTAHYSVLRGKSELILDGTYLGMVATFQNRSNPLATQADPVIDKATCVITREIAVEVLKAIVTFQSRSEFASVSLWIGGCEVNFGYQTNMPQTPWYISCTGYGYWIPLRTQELKRFIEELEYFFELTIVTNPT